MLEILRSEPAVAVDTESNSLYEYYERICVIQFSVPRGDYIVDALSEIDLSSLGALFANPAVEKVFHAAEQDVAGLRRDFSFQFARLFDTMWAARILGWPEIGLASLLQEHFGVRSEKRYQRYNWGKRPLEPEAIAYARMDVHHLLSLRAIQAEQLEREGRLEEAEEVFAQVAQTSAAVVPFGPEAFWRVKGTRDLNSQELAVLWKLYMWRDQEASRRNRPPFKVMGDRTLVALAQIQPHTIHRLREVPGVSRYVRQRYGEAVLSVIARGESAQAPQRPRSSPRPAQVALARHRALRTWRRRMAEQRGVDPDVIISNSALWQLAERNPGTLEDLEGIEGLGPWKRRAYGPEILRVLRARAQRGQKSKT
jgi:ribonuclease D